MGRGKGEPREMLLGKNEFRRERVPVEERIFKTYGKLVDSLQAFIAEKKALLESGKLDDDPDKKENLERQISISENAIYERYQNTEDMVLIKKGLTGYLESSYYIHAAGGEKFQKHADRLIDLIKEYEGINKNFIAPETRTEQQLVTKTIDYVNIQIDPEGEPLWINKQELDQLTRKYEDHQVEADEFNTEYLDKIVDAGLLEKKGSVYHANLRWYDFCDDNRIFIGLAAGNFR